MKKVVKIFFVRDNDRERYDAARDCFEVFRIAVAKKLEGLSAFKVAEKDGCLMIKDPNGNEVHICEKKFLGNYSGEDLFSALYSDVVDYGHLLDEFGLTKEDFDTRTLIVKDFMDSDVEKAFEKIVAHYLDNDRPGCQPFFITRFRRLYMVHCLPIMFSPFDLSQQICETYGLNEEEDEEDYGDVFGPYSRWLNIAWSIDSGDKECAFHEFYSKEGCQKRPIYMIPVFSTLLIIATALFAVEPVKTRGARA